jgi:uncharacterized surface anchored protein
MPKKIYFLSEVMFLLTTYSLQAAGTGSISGTVKDYLDNPVNNAQIEVARSKGPNDPTGCIEVVRIVFSEADGTYSASDLPEGTYRLLRCTPPTGTRLAIQWAEDINVTAEEVTTVNFTLPLGGTISGKVTNTEDSPLSGIVTQVIAPEGHYRFCGTGMQTDISGDYTLSNIPEGTWGLGAHPPEGSPYVSKEVTGISVTASQTTTVNITLSRGASISGVVKNSSGVGQANVQVNCWADDGYGTGTQSEANGFYRCGGLPVGYNYNVVAYPLPDSNYMITRISVGVYQPGEYTGKDIVLGNGGLKISGKVTDKATTLPLADVRVGYWCEDFEIGIGTRTDVNGMYLLTNLPPGYAQIRAEPESYYACIRIEFELTGDINNLDFALPAGAILSGKVLDADTAEPLAGVEIKYWSERYAVNRNLSTDADGTFCLTQLPPGIAVVKAEPDVDSGYAWNLPGASELVCLGEGENRSERIIALKKGALVRGYIKDVNGNPISGIEYDYSGRGCGGWGNTDVNGFYQIRLLWGYMLSHWKTQMSSAHCLR